MTLEEMKARLAEVQDALRAIHEESGDAALNEERQTEWDGLSDELTTLRSDITKAEKRIETVRSLGEKKEHRDAPAYIKTHTDSELYDLNALRLESSSAEDYVSRATDNARRAVERSVKSFGMKDKEAAAEHAESLLLEVDNTSGDLAKRYLATGADEYARAFAKIMKNGSDVMCTPEERMALVRANQTLGTDTEGGYAVPFQLDPTVMHTSAGVVNPLRELARVEKIVGKEWQGVTSAGVDVVRGSETTTAPNTEFTLGQPTVRTNRVQGFVQFSMEIDLGWNALRSEITKMLVDAKAREEESFTTGDGSTGVQPGGINGSLAAGQNVLTAAIDTFAVADLYALEEALDARWEGNASLLAHKSVYNAIRQFDSSGGANLWVRIGDGTPSRLLDYPTYRSTALPTLTAAKAGSANAASSTIMIFGDFKQFLIVDRIGMNVEMVPHVFDSANGNRPTGKRGVYAIWMNNSKVLIPNAFRRLSVKQA